MLKTENLKRGNGNTHTHTHRPSISSASSWFDPCQENVGQWGPEPRQASLAPSPCNQAGEFRDSNSSFQSLQALGAEIGQFGKVIKGQSLYVEWINLRCHKFNAGNVWGDISMSITIYLFIKLASKTNLRLLS